MNIIDQVTYTASLISNPKDVEQKLDVLRSITARLQPNTPLTQEDTAALQKLQSELETYLVEKERSRSFTQESLQIQIEQHFRGAGMYKKSRLQLVAITGVVLVAIVGAILLPVSTTIPERVQLAGAAAFSVLHLGAVDTWAGTRGSCGISHLRIPNAYGHSTCPRGLYV